MDLGKTGAWNGPPCPSRRFPGCHRDRTAKNSVCESDSSGTLRNIFFCRVNIFFCSPNIFRNPAGRLWNLRGWFVLTPGLFRTTRHMLGNCRTVLVTPRTLFIKQEGILRRTSGELLNVGDVL